MASLRDGHQNRLYAAQDDVFKGVGRDLDSREAVQAYCDKVVRSACFKRLWVANAGQQFADPVRSCPTRLRVRHFTGRGAYHYGGTNEIRVGSERWQRYVVLHEIAHRLDPDLAHGPSFCWIYLALIRRFLPESGPALTAAYRARRVRYRRVS